MSAEMTDRSRGPGRHPARRVPGETGVWVFILGDMTFFAILFVVYLHNRALSPQAFGDTQAALDVDLGATNTIVLLVSSLCVVVAVGALRNGVTRLARQMIAAAELCGLVFSTVKIVEYHQEVAQGHTPMENGFLLYYFLLTGIHWFHLLLGMAVLAALFVLAGKSALSPARLAFVEGGACFWHMVDLLWLVLFPLLYMVR